jgi:alpha-L-fucosidase
MAANGEAIHGSRPWRIYGEGPTQLGEGMFGETKFKGFQPEDVRFTVKDGVLHMMLLQWPTGPVRVPSLGLGALKDGIIARATLLGGGPVAVRQEADAATFTLPRAQPGQFVPVLRLDGAGLA